MNKYQLAFEVLEERIAMSLAPGLLPSPIYLNPTLLTFASEQAPVETSRDLSALEHKYRFSVQTGSGLDWQDYAWNWGGLREKWLKGGDGSWYFLLPQGDLYRWQQGSLPVKGTLVARLGESQLDSPTAKGLADLNHQYSFVATGSFWADWGRQDERWVQTAGGSWCYILPGGQVYEWVEGSYPLKGNLLADLAAGGTYLPESKIYQYPTFLTDADRTIPLESSADAYALQQKYGFFSAGTYWQNWGGLNEKWIEGSGAAWFYVLPHGALYRWDRQAGPLRGTLVSLMDPAVYENPYALTEPSAAAPNAPATISLISDLSRTHLPDPATVGESGGFSPNLRSLMRASDGSLWFTEDVAQSFWVNLGTRYFRQDPASGAWQLMGETTFLPGVRENGATLMKDDVIYTYVLVAGSSAVQESYFSTRDPSVRGSHYIYAGGSSDRQATYLGAAVSPSGKRVVWWTEYPPSNGSGVFVYLYDDGSGWEGPVVSGLNANRSFAYAYAGFVSDTHLVLGGELYDLPMSFQATIGELELGQPLSLVAGLYSTSGVNIRTVEDLWVDPVTKDIHVLAETGSPVYGDDYAQTLQERKLAYFYKPGGKSWSGHTNALYTFDDTFRGRFLVSAADLYLIRGTTNGGGIRYLSVPRADITGAVDWGNIQESSIGGLPLGFSIANGIWVEDSSHQTQPVQGTDFVFTGNWPWQDKYLWDVRLPS